jgi:hypothetical protein
MYEMALEALVHTLPTGCATRSQQAGCVVQSGFTHAMRNEITANEQHNRQGLSLDSSFPMSGEAARYEKCSAHPVWYDEQARKREALAPDGERGDRPAGYGFVVAKSWPLSLDGAPCSKVRSSAWERS